MKLIIDPMPALRAKAVDEINMHFARRFAGMKHTVHLRKAEQARQALTGDVAPTFAAEAGLRGLSVADFAHLVLAKEAEGDGWDAAELERQRALLAVEAAQTPGEIDGIVKGTR